MPRQNRNDWLVRVHGNQRNDIELDLLAQIVIMLGWQLRQETLTEENDLDNTDSHN